MQENAINDTSEMRCNKLRNINTLFAIVSVHCFPLTKMYITAEGSLTVVSMSVT